MLQFIKNKLNNFRSNTKFGKQLDFLVWRYRTKQERAVFKELNIKIVSSELTVSAIIDHRKSISRFGDGELRLIINQGKIVFQEGNLKLSKRLQEVLQSNLDNHIVALPMPFVNQDKLKLNVKYFWLQYMNMYSTAFSKYIRSNSVYGNSYITRFYIDYEDKSNVKKDIECVKKIWFQQDVLLVEGALSRLGVGNDLFAEAKSLQRVLCSSENAFDHYDRILEKAKEFGRDKLILIALGPTATVLSYDLAKADYWALDVGHIDVEYMWMLQNAPTKIPIKGRYVSESRSEKDYDIPEEYKDNYLNSILYRFED